MLVSTKKSIKKKEI